MIQQMMTLMCIEMQLRQQALFNFQQSQDSDAEQTPRLDDALALNSQLSEISSVLSTLIRSNSVGQRSSRRRPAYRELPGAQRLRRADGSGFVRSAALCRLSNVSSRLWRETDTAVNYDSSATDNDDDSDDDGVLGMNSTAAVNHAVDDFIWQQLNESERSSPESLPTASTEPDIQSVSSMLSIPPSVPSVASNQSLLSISTINSYVPSVSPGFFNDSRQVTPSFMVCMNNCQHATAEGE